MSTTEPVADNGVNVEHLLGARTALTDAPEAAEFTWRASTEWVRGTRTETTVDDYSGLGETHSHKTSFSYTADHPEVFASEDNGPTPVEYVLVALGSCLTAGVASVAQQREIQLRSVKATLSAEHDLHGILGADPEVRNGFNGVKVDYEIDADASPEDIRAIVAQSQKRSAVFDIVTNPTDVSVTVV